MALLERLQILIDADGKGLVREFEKAGKEADKLDAKLKSGAEKTSAKLTSIGTKAALGGVAIIGGLAALAKASDEAEIQQTKLQNSIKNSDQAFRNGGKGLVDLANGLQQVTAADGDAIVGAESLLIQFGLTEGQVKRITPLVVDLSRKMGIDLDQAAKLVGKSVGGNAGALKKMGIEVDATKLKTDSFSATVDALSGSVGGFARQEGATFSGQIAILKNNLGDLGETVGKGAASVFGDLAGGANGAIRALNSLNPAVGETAGRLGAIGGVGATTVGTLMVVAGQFSKLKDAAVDAEGGLTAFGKAGAAIAAVTVAVGAFEATAGVLNGVRNISQQQATAFSALGNAAKMSSKDVTDVFSELARLEDLKVKPSKIITDFTDSTVDFDGVKVRVSEVKKSFEDLLKTGNTAAGEKVIKGLEAQTRTLDKNSDEYRNNYEAVAALKKKLAEYRGSVDLAVQGQAEQAKAVQEATDKYNKQNVTLEYVQEQLKITADKVKVLTSQYDSAQTAAKAFGDSLERSAPGESFGRDVVDLAGKLRTLGDDIKGLPSFADSLDPAKITEGGGKAISAFYQIADTAKKVISDAIAAGSPDAAAIAENYRTSIVQGLQAAGLSKEDIDRYLHNAGLDQASIEVALTFSRDAQAKAQLDTYLAVFGADLQNNPIWKQQIQPFIDSGNVMGQLLVTKAALQGTLTANPLVLPVTIGAPTDPTGGGMPGAFGPGQGVVPTPAPTAPPPLPKPAKKKERPWWTRVPFFAEGGNPPVGMPSMVNERGPEMFIPRTPGFVMNSSESKRLVAGVEAMLAGGGGHTFNITSTDPHRSALEIVRTQRDAAYLIGR